MEAHAHTTVSTGPPTASSLQALQKQEQAKKSPCQQNIQGYSGLFRAIECHHLPPSSKGSPALTGLS